MEEKILQDEQPSHVHGHCPFLSVSAAFGLGIYLAQIMSLGLAAAGWIIAGLMVLVVILRRHLYLMTIGVLVFFMCLGFFYARVRTSTLDTDIDHKARYYLSAPVKLRGQVISEIQERPFFNGYKTSFILRLASVESPWGWRPVSGRILVQLFSDHDLNYGDELELTGKLHRPFEFSTETTFSYRQWLGYRGVKLILSMKKDQVAKIISEGNGYFWKRAALRSRDYLKNILAEYLTANEAGIMQAVILGDRTFVPKQIRELFIQTGTAHILAISGLHIGIVAGLFFGLMRILSWPRRGCFALTIIFLIAYAFLTGGRPSVIRAVVMISIFFVSLMAERRVNPLNSLCLAAFMILLLSPMYLFDVGFQLSFVCVFSILILHPKLKVLLYRRMTLPRWADQYFYEPLCMSLSIWLGVAGMIAYYFHLITPVTIFANVFIIPMITIVVTLGFGLLLIGCLWPMGAACAAAVLKLFLNIMVAGTFVFDLLPYGSFWVSNVSFWSLGIYYFFVLLAAFWPVQSKKIPRGLVIDKESQV